MALAPEHAAAKILIVDDQSSNVRLLEHTLRRAGYTEVTSTTDPCAVLALQLEHQYDLILLDLQMPVMDGFAVLEQLREGRLSQPVAILVISAGSSDMPAALESGGDSFLAKPFRLPDVVERVQRMLKEAGVAAVVAVTQVGVLDPEPE
jgi:CheY-like chemotaxis protein